MVETSEDIVCRADVDHDFYALILDRRYRARSAALWEGAASLEEAQHRKLARLAEFAGVRPGSTVLDIGCGWGAMLRYALDYAGAAAATGVTPSEQEYAYVAGLAQRQVDVQFVSWQEFAPAKRFDALVTIGAFEHFASAEDCSRGEQRRVYAEFFDWCRAVSNDGARLGLQTIVALREPETEQEVADMRCMVAHAFPDSALPRISDIQAGMQDRYEVRDAREAGEDYARTLAAWRARLAAEREEVESRYGEACHAGFARYFAAAERCFRAGVTGLMQLSLQPIRPAVSFGR